ncbi:MAG TPA: DUF6265 family protein [Acidobacteriota bacterium]|nr:DUF6265 family protein [Acidobacteriota bacterium]
MKQLLLLLLLAAATVSAEEPAAWTSMSWLAGCWTGTGKVDMMEHWMPPGGGMMLGMSRTVREGKSTVFEFMRIVQDGGKCYFVARPSDQAETRFELVKSGPLEMVFENTRHDFPQRILYRLQPDGTLMARIEGKQDGKDEAVDFLMKRTQCAGESAVCQAE